MSPVSCDCTRYLDAQMGLSNIAVVGRERLTQYSLKQSFWKRFWKIVATELNPFPAAADPSHLPAANNTATFKYGNAPFAASGRHEPGAAPRNLPLHYAKCTGTVEMVRHGLSVTAWVWSFVTTPLHPLPCHHHCAFCLVTITAPFATPLRHTTAPFALSSLHPKFALLSLRPLPHRSALPCHHHCILCLVTITAPFALSPLRPLPHHCAFCLVTLLVVLVVP